MKTLKFIGMAVLAVLIGIGFAACASDDGNNGDGSKGKVNTSSVFTGGLPKSIDGMQITYNSDGTLASISNDDTRVSFVYGKNTRAVADNSVRMTIYDDDELFATCDMTLNTDGYAKFCTETDYEGNVQTWTFGYNSAGQLNYMKRSEGGNEITNITYTNGNIVKTNTVSEDEPSESSECSITYSDMVNKGCIMLFDATLGIDMDEMEYAYYAGMLGKATKNLPKSNVDEDGDTTDFTWTLNSNGLPAKLTASDNTGYSESCIFNW